jgi:hypothetical protein
LNSQILKRKAAKFAQLLLFGFRETLLDEGMNIHTAQSKQEPITRSDIYGNEDNFRQKHVSSF